jgi:predicted SAM-dependent methyltransferase
MTMAAEQVEPVLKGLKLHLGCGPHVKPGWANCDMIDHPGVNRMDLTQPLPVADNTVSAIFTEHFVEHISLGQFRGFLAECHRVLVPWGVLRISTPSLKAIVTAYLEGTWRGVPEHGWAPTSACDYLNEALRSWGHTYVYDGPKLEACLEEAGFQFVRPVAWGESVIPDLCGLETRGQQDDLIYEATKLA